MVGTGLKKLAKENNMNVDKGVAYGSLHGYAVTLSEGSGYKLLQIATVFDEPQSKFNLETILNGKNLMKEFRVQNVVFSEKAIVILFYDNPGTMKRIYSFIEWFCPLLEENGASRWNVCVECGEEITAGQWKLIDGMAYHFHTSCARRVEAEIVREDEVRKAEDTGSYAKGLVGALLGSALSAVLWAFVLAMGYMASIVGFVIGWMAEKGYHLLHGKNGKGKIAILIFAVIFGVMFGTMLGETISIVNLIRTGELAGWAYGDIPYLFSLLFMDGEYVGSVVTNILIGFVFAGLGIFSLVRRANKEVSDVKVQDLK